MDPSASEDRHHRNRRVWKRLAAFTALALVGALAAAAVYVRSYDAPAAIVGAARTGDQRTLKLLLRFRPALATDSTTGETPLHAALAAHHKAAANLLLANNADVNAGDRLGLTPLHCALLARNVEAAQFLLEHEADVNAATPDGFTPLLIAVDTRQPALVLALLDRRADPAALDPDGHTLLERHWSPDCHDIVRVLLERGTRADPAYLAPALAVALQHGDTAVVQSYLGGCPSVSQPSRLRSANGGTLLHLAAGLNSVELARLLVAQGASASAPNTARKTPLDLAVEAPAPNLALVKLFLSERADAGAENLYCAFDAALNAGEKSLVRSYLAVTGSLNRKRDPAGRSFLLLAVTAGNRDAVELLLALGADVNTPSWQGLSPLHVAVTAPRSAKEITQLLLAAKADPDAVDLFDRTPLHLAVLGGAKLDLIRLLLNAGAKVEARCCDKYTPLHRAAAAGNLDLVKLLVEYKANINAADRNGQLPLHYAAMSGYTEMAEFLIASGSSCNVKDHSGARPIRYAVQNGHSAIADMVTRKTEKREKRK